MPQPPPTPRDHAPIHLWHPTIDDTPITSIPHLHATIDAEYPGLKRDISARSDAMGNSLWTRTYGTATLPESGHDLLQLADGSFLITGQTHVENVNNGDAWLLQVMDIPIMHYVIAQGFLAGIIISLTVLVTTVIIMVYYFIRRRRLRSE
jgi:hypothetical protein